MRCCLATYVYCGRRDGTVLYSTSHYLLTRPLGQLPTYLRFVSPKSTRIELGLRMAEMKIRGIQYMSLFYLRK
jgi:hypothetical protein